MGGLPFKIWLLSRRIKTFWVLSQGRVQIFLVVPKVLILVPREGKNLFCPEDLEFLSRTSKNLEFLSRTKNEVWVRDKNSRFFEVSDKNSRSEGQNKFLPSRGTKIKTWGTTRNICTLPRDNTQKVLILSDNNQILKESPPKNWKTSFCWGRKQPVKNNRTSFFLIYFVFFSEANSYTKAPIHRSKKSFKKLQIKRQIW